MIDYKEEIAKRIDKIIDIKIERIKTFIEIPPNSEMGDYSFPCFKLAKEFKNPQWRLLKR